MRAAGPAQSNDRQAFVPFVGPIRDRPKLHVVIARDVAERIKADGWPVGRVLGSEGALARYYGVSTSVMREAGRLLEHQRIVSITRGPAGGLTIREPSAEAVAHAIAIVFDFSGVSLGELLQVKALLEAWSARAAAQRITAQGMSRLDQAVELATSAEGESPLAHRRDGLHAVVAQESGNPVSVMLHAAVTSVVVRYSPAALRQDASPGDTVVTVRRAHSRILDAIKAGDPDRAERRMNKHVEAMSQWLLASHGERMVWTDVDVKKAAALGDSSRAKLAEIVAERLRDEILLNGWEVGVWLGTEPALLERYAISRSVLREAIRLLEHHSVVAYRPGSSGGLVVDRPNGDAIVDAALSYLSFHSVQLADLDEMRALFEAHGVRLAASRSAVVTSVLARHLGVPDTGDDAQPCESRLHVTLGEVSGNRALALIVELLMQLRSTLSGEQVARDPAVNSSTVAHALVVEAVLAGKGDDAAALMTAHLRRNAAAATLDDHDN